MALFKNSNTPLTAITITLALMPGSVHAVQEDDFLVRFGVSNVSPDDSSTGFTGAASVAVAVYFIAPYTAFIQTIQGSDIQKLVLDTYT